MIYYLYPLLSLWYMKVIIFRECSLKKPYQIKGEIIACGNLITGNLQNELDLIFTMSRNLGLFDQIICFCPKIHQKVAFTNILKYIPSEYHEDKAKLTLSVPISFIVLCKAIKAGWIWVLSCFNVNIYYIQINITVK